MNSKARWTIWSIAFALSLLLVIFASIMKLVERNEYQVRIACPSGSPWYNTETGWCYPAPEVGTP